ncbi:HDOD domain-containing protein [Bermanella sp. R86510]|uniref:HDOD domain-containing protein n=1 Tax=unclassified Bermanella TaxID=2627862 RepID=UPI0037C8A24C
MSELSQEQIQTILQGISIPPQPQIMVDLQMEQVMPDPDINRIAELIKQDVGLAGTVLKVVNSPFYGLSNDITSIEQAVGILGMGSVVNIVNGISIKSSLNDEAIRSLTRFWDTAMDVAMTSATIAKQVGYPHPDNAYTLGLFHNCGVPLLMSRFPNYMEIMEESYSQGYERVIDLENQQLQTNHAVIGYYTAKSWNMPKVLCEIIAEHHDCKRLYRENRVENDKTTLMSILKMAEHICGNYKILGRQNRDYEWDDVGGYVLEYLGFSDYDLSNFKEIFSEMGISPNNYGLN